MIEREHGAISKDEQKQFKAVTDKNMEISHKSKTENWKPT